jgi:hypothetical protein
VPGSLVGGVFAVGQERPVVAIVRRVLKTRRHWGTVEHGGTIGKLPSMRRRRGWARRIARLLEAASSSRSAWRFPHPDFEAPLLMSTRVVWACRPEFLAIEEALQDQRQPISASALRELQTFLTDLPASTLFGTDPVAARQAARQVQHSFTGHPELGEPP